jgi:HlyD family secretion protein
VISEILARDGAWVEAGALLVNLDGADLRSEFTIVETQLIELAVRRARLEAEQGGRDFVVFPKQIKLRAKTDTAVADQIAGQRTLFEARLEASNQQRQELEERIAQTKNQIDGTQAQLEALGQQADLIAEELANQEELFEKGLVQAQRVMILRRDAAAARGDIGRLTAEVALLQGEIAKLKLEQVQLKTARREEAVSRLRDLHFRELELQEKSVALARRLQRLELRAPVSGVVYGSTVFARNAVVRPAEPVMYIVPQDQPLIVSTRTESRHIDQVHVGQDASLRFTAFSQRMTPEINGTVVLVSADTFRDEITGQHFYQVNIKPDPVELLALDNQTLLPGMPVEAFLKTEDRTPLSYLLKPLSDYFRRALRES